MKNKSTLIIIVICILAGFVLASIIIGIESGSKFMRNIPNITIAHDNSEKIVKASYPYCFRGTLETIELRLNTSAYDEITHQNSATHGKEIYDQVLNNSIQRLELKELLDTIKARSSNPDDQARIAISFVQMIPYDSETGDNRKNISGKLHMPYAVVYDDKGICQDKSWLLAYLLRKLGYEVVILKFIPEGHDAIGIKVTQKYGYNNSDYAFIETTTPTIPSAPQAEYKGVGKLWSVPRIHKISTGCSFDSISEEYSDVKALTDINNYISNWSSETGSTTELLQKTGKRIDIINKYCLDSGKFLPLPHSCKDNPASC
jgi:hypothetical protein